MQSPFNKIIWPFVMTEVLKIAIAIIYILFALELFVNITLLVILNAVLYNATGTLFIT